MIVKILYMLNLTLFEKKGEKITFSHLNSNRVLNSTKLRLF